MNIFYAFFVDPMAGVVDEDAAMTPPLELCIRTRYGKNLYKKNQGVPSATPLLFENFALFRYLTP